MLLMRIRRPMYDGKPEIVVVLQMRKISLLRICSVAEDGSSGRTFLSIMSQIRITEPLK